MGLWVKSPRTVPVDEFTLFTVRGLAARALKLAIGGPLVLVGVVLVVIGAGVSGLLAAAVPVGIGGLLGFVGLYFCYGAVRSDEFSVTYGSGSGRQGE